LIDAERVDFIAVPTLDQGRSVRFYGETLGLARNPGSSARWVEFETGNVTIALLPHEFTGRTEFRPSSAPIAIRVPDVATARQKLEESGVASLGETIDSGVCHIAPFADPDGNSPLLHRRHGP
jgi:predicted enzyme related to lactoylglutathione lyase